MAEFLSTDIVQKDNAQFLDNRSSVSTASAKSPVKPSTPTSTSKTSEGPVKRGYLTKRGKNFGGWQTRYFVLDGPLLKYYDMVYALYNCQLISAEWIPSGEHQVTASANRSTKCATSNGDR